MRAPDSFRCGGCESQCLIGFDLGLTPAQTEPRLRLGRQRPLRGNAVPEANRKRNYQKEATARSANRRLPVNFKALIRRLTIGGHARQR